MYPDAPVFTLFHFPGSQHPEIEAREIRTTFLQKLVSPSRNYRTLLPLFLAAAETWDLSGYDLVISTSHCVAKNAKKKDAGTFHLCYCHTPVRYLHDQFDDYFRGRPAPVGLGARRARAPLAAWDVATVPRVDAFLANSANVKDRIARLWRRDAAVVPPPVDTEFYSPGPLRERRGLLIVSALAPYKRLDDAIEAANARKLPLTIAGFGPERRRLEAMAGETVVFADTPNDTMLRELYRSAEAVLMPGEEDFGIVPLEAQACGTPVIALGKGGALETVRDGQTGVLMPVPGPAALLGALDRLRSLRLDPAAAAANAARFSREAFREGFRRALDEARAHPGASPRKMAPPVTV